MQKMETDEEYGGTSFLLYYFFGAGTNQKQRRDLEEGTFVWSTEETVASVL